MDIGNKAGKYLIILLYFVFLGMLFLCSFSWFKPIQKIVELYRQQLMTIFKFVTKKPLVLRNSHNYPIYHFAFALNNETAFRIANDIIGGRKK
jgi:hypothetical protein